MFFGSFAHLFGPNIVRSQAALVSDVEPPATNHGMSPGRQAAIGDFKTALFTISGRSRLDEADDVVFTENVQIAIGIGHGALADTAITPGYFPGVELQGCQNRVAEAVKVPIYQHDTAMMVFHVPSEIGLGRFHVFALGCEIEQGATRVVPRRIEDFIVREDGRCDVGRAVGRLRVAPQQLSVRRTKTDSGVCSECHQGANTTDVCCDQRRITWRVAESLAGPYSLTCHLVECDNRGIASTR